MERKEGLEPFIFGLEDRCSTFELLPLEPRAWI